MLTIFVMPYYQDGSRDQEKNPAARDDRADSSHHNENPDGRPEEKKKDPRDP